METWHFVPQPITTWSSSGIPTIRPVSIKEWWGNRAENEQAWRVPVERISESGWNLDIKNPFIKEEEVTHTTAELLDMLSSSFMKSNELIDELKKGLK